MVEVIALIGAGFIGGTVFTTLVLRLRRSAAWNDGYEAGMTEAKLREIEPRPDRPDVGKVFESRFFPW